MLNFNISNLSSSFKLIFGSIGIALLIFCGIFAVSVLLISPPKVFDRGSQGQTPEVEVAREAEVAPLAAPSPEPKPDQITLIFVGDMMFDRHIRSNAEKQGNYEFILEPMTAHFADADLIIGNLEGPITTNKSRSQGSIPGSTDNFYFTFDPAIISLLKKYPFVVNLGNNHITNFGADGIDQTLQFLSDAQIPYFGQIGRDNQVEAETLITEVGQVKLGLVNYNEFLPGGLGKSLAAIAKIKDQVDLVIVYTHWGAEYVPIANEVISAQARSFVDAGANLVIGSHPHVIQNSEIYQGVPIYYSLGNFIFDQYFSQEVMTGQVVTAVIDPVSLEISTSEQLVSLDKTGITSPLMVGGGSGGGDQ